MSIDCAGRSYVGVEANHVSEASLVSGARSRRILRLGAVVLAAASLAACAQSSAVRTSGFTSSGRQASVPHDRTASFVNIGRVASTRKHTPFVRHNNAPATQIASRGVASFYTEDQETASGEKFNTHDLTAAHRSLPFGTRLRVTNVSTGRSVTVRINDRGPYVAGRVVDLSESAASALGMVESGIAKVKLDVVR